MVYNLVQDKGREEIQLHQLGGYVDKLAAIMKNHEEDDDIPKIVLLGHQYTSSNFIMEALKLNDRPKAEVILLAAQKAGFYANLGLVTSYQSGELENMAIGYPNLDIGAVITMILETMITKT